MSRSRSPRSPRSPRSLRSVVGIAASAAVLPLLVGACGDGSDSAGSADPTTTTIGTTTTTTDSSSGAAPSSEEFLTQANAICSTGNQQIEAIFAGVPAGAAPSTDQQQELLDNVSQQLDDIEALGVPSDLDAEVEPFITQARTTVEQSRTQPAEQFFSAGNPFADVNKTAVAAGLGTCGS